MTPVEEVVERITEPVDDSVTELFVLYPLRPSYPADAYFNTHAFGVLPTSSTRIQIWKNGVISNC